MACESGSDWMTSNSQLSGCQWVVLSAGSDVPAACERHHRRPAPPPPRHLVAPLCENSSCSLHVLSRGASIACVCSAAADRGASIAWPQSKPSQNRPCTSCCGGQRQRLHTTSRLCELEAHSRGAAHRVVEVSGTCSGDNSAGCADSLRKRSDSEGRLGWPRLCPLAGPPMWPLWR